MIKYAFPQFKVEIVDPTITNIVVTDNISEKKCIVNCVLLDSSGSSFGVEIGTKTYKDTWNDSDIISFIESELNNFLVK
jgi:hypothetical protein